MPASAVSTQMTKVRASAAAVVALANNKGQQQQQQQQAQHQVPNNSNLAAIMAQVQLDYGKYKYTVYRCASKFVALQQIFHTSTIPYKLVLAILERHGLSAGSTNAGASSLNLMVPPFQLTSLLHDIFFACEKLGHFSKASGYQLDKATALLANFFWNIYDPQRRHSISLLEIKLTLLLLCKLYSSEHLVADVYALLADPKSPGVSRYAFEQLLLTLSKLLGHVGEAKAYGPHNVGQMMAQCFARCHSGSGLTEAQFQQLWSGTQTRFLIYANLLALIKRIEDTRHLVHGNQCAGCRLERIIGIRFKCQVCRDLSLCLPCFATGYVSSRHEAVHRMCEVFVEDQPTAQPWTRYLARLCGWLATDEEEEERRGFCNAHESTACMGQANASTELAPIPVQTRSIRSGSCRPPPQQQPDLCALNGLATTASNASERLQSIIDRLLQQNAKLETQLQLLASTSRAQISEFLSAHQTFLLQIIEDMRQLSHASSTHRAAPLISSTFLTASTPKPPPSRSYEAYLTHSINGADLNRSYLEANKSDYSLSDLSLWFDQRRPSLSQGGLLPQRPAPAVRDTEMANFQLLLHKVKEIVEDSYSDNAEVSAATQNLEHVLDSLIKGEEQQRRPSP